MEIVTGPEKGFPVYPVLMVVFFRVKKEPAFLVLRR
jgi:hypothetical protein